MKQSGCLFRIFVPCMVGFCETTWCGRRTPAASVGIAYRARIEGDNGVHDFVRPFGLSWPFAVEPTSHPTVTRTVNIEAQRQLPYPFGCCFVGPIIDPEHRDVKCFTCDQRNRLSFWEYSSLKALPPMPTPPQLEIRLLLDTPLSPALHGQAAEGSGLPLTQSSASARAKEGQNDR